MRKTIERNIIVNTVLSKSFDNDFKVIDNKPFEMYGKITQAMADKKATEIYGKSTKVTEIKTNNNRYEITVKKFIENATLKNE